MSWKLVEAGPRPLAVLPRRKERINWEPGRVADLLGVQSTQPRAPGPYVEPHWSSWFRNTPALRRDPRAPDSAVRCAPSSLRAHYSSARGLRGRALLLLRTHRSSTKHAGRLFPGSMCALPAVSETMSARAEV